MFTSRRLAPLAAALLLGTAAFSLPAGAETLSQALATAYSSNPTLNAARASLRATDEGVPQALAGYRPTVTGSASYGLGFNRLRSSSTAGRTVDVDSSTASYSITVEQPIFRGFRTENGVKQAESSVLAARESLRSTEQDVLLDAVTAYADVIQAQAIVTLRQQNIEFLREQVRAAQDRLNVGEGTRTDVAQTEARLAEGESDYNTAVANLNSARATYVQIIGVQPRSLSAPRFNDKLLPKSVDNAVDTGLTRHPAILASGYNVDTASFNVKVIEGELLPTVGLQASVSHDNEYVGDTFTTSAQVLGVVNVPIYEGGATYSRVRQAKETLGQRRIELDSARDQVRASVISNWGQLTAARAQIEAANSQVRATQLALNGVIEERRVGQRTTLDVLNQQQEVLTARESLIVATRNSVVAAYSLLSATGGLTAEKLGLAVKSYEPREHYQAVRDKWIGLRTPDGR